MLPAGRPHQEALAHFEQFRAEIQALPEGERRPHLFRRIFAEGHATSKLPELLEVARGWQPQAIVYESGDLAAPAVAAALELPTANHSFGVMVPLAAVRHAAEHMAPLWRSVGVEPDDNAGAFRGLYIDLSPPSFAWEEPLGDSIRLGHVPAAPGDLPAWLDELGRPLVYVTLGTVFNKPELLRRLLDGLDGSVSALVTTGRNVDPESLGESAAERSGRALRAAGAGVAPLRSRRRARRVGQRPRRARARLAARPRARREQISSTTLRAARL